MTTIVRSVAFGRHGQSEQNLIKPEKQVVTHEQLSQFKSRDTGDHRLTDRGVREARALGELLRTLNLQFDLLVTSSFVRAQETLLETGLSGAVEISPLLDERFSGAHEPLLKSEVEEFYPTAEQDRKNKETRWRPENGESMRDVLTRVLLCIVHLNELTKGNGDIFIVAHSRVIASYMWWAEQLEDHEVPSAADASSGDKKIANGQVLQYGWAGESLRPTYKRSFVPGSPVDLQWVPLPPSSRFQVRDLRAMVDRYPRIL